MLLFIVLGRNASILWKSSWIFFRAKDTDNFIEQVYTMEFYLKKNNDGRVVFFAHSFGIFDVARLKNSILLLLYMTFFVHCVLNLLDYIL